MQKYKVPCGSPDLGIGLFVFILLQFFSPYESNAQGSAYWKSQVKKFKSIVAENKQDSTAVQALCELAREYMYQDPDSAVVFGESARELARKIEWKAGEGYALVSTSYVHRNKEEYSVSQSLLEEALSIFESIPHKVGIAKVTNEISYLKYLQSDFVGAIEELEKVYALEFEIGNKERSARAVGAIGAINLLRDNYPLALKSLEKALLTQESLGDSVNMGNTMINIANLHLVINDTLKAEKSFQKIVSFKRLNDDAHYAALIGLGQLSAGRGSYQDALDYFKEPLMFEESAKDERSVAKIYGHMSDVLHQMGDLDQAFKKANEALEINKRFDNKLDISKNQLLLGKLYAKKGEVSQALRNSKSALALAQEIKDPSTVKEALLLLSQLNFKAGNASEAYRNLQRHTHLKDSILNETKIKEATQTAMQYDFKRVQLADSLAYHQEKILLENELATASQRRKWMIVLAFVLGLLLLQAVLFARKRRRNNDALRQSNQLLGEKNKQNEVLLEEIHHRVKNNLQVVSSLLSLQSSAIQDGPALDAVNAGRNRVSSMALIHEKLYQGENLTNIEMKDYFETVGNALLESFGDRASNVNLKVDMTELELDVDTAVPIGLVVTELLTNSLKYAFEESADGGNIHISMNEVTPSKIRLVVSDDGVNKGEGISESGTGFGTRLIRMLTRQLDGELQQSISNGTKTTIEFPKPIDAAA